MKAKTLRIGITGGIGSGKTTVCRIFGVLGIPVFDADMAAKTLMQQDPALRAALMETFGSRVYDAGGQLDRAYLASRVFGDAAELARLNALVHPAVIRYGENWAAEQAIAHHAPYTIKEAALLFESGSYRLNDFNILVSAPEEERIRRVMARDGASRQQVLDRISKQMPESEKAELADFMIDNGGVLPVIPQVLALHEHFLSLRNQE